MPDHISAKVKIGSLVSEISENSYTGVDRFVVPILQAEVIGIIASSSTNGQLRIQLPSYPQVGTSNVKASGEYSAVYFDNATQTFYSSADNSGTITIESLSASHIRGKFQFKCYDNNLNLAEVTEGFFDGDL